MFKVPKKSKREGIEVDCTKEHQEAFDFGKTGNFSHVAFLKNLSLKKHHDSSDDMIHVIDMATGKVAIFLSIEQCVKTMNDLQNDDQIAVLYKARVDSVGKAKNIRKSLWKECDESLLHEEKPASMQVTTTGAVDHVCMCSVQQKMSHTAHQLSLQKGFTPTLEERLRSAATVRRITNNLKNLSAVVAIGNNSRINQIVPVFEGGTTLSCWKNQHDDTLNYGVKCWSLTGSLYRTTQALRAAEHMEIIQVHAIVAAEYLKQAKNYGPDSYNFYFLNLMGQLMNEFIVRFVN